MNEKQIAEIERRKCNVEVNDLMASIDIDALINEVRRLRAVLAEYADRANWSPFDEHGMNLSEWLPEQKGWKRAENVLREDGE